MSKLEEEILYTYSYKDILVLEFGFIEHSLDIDELLKKLRLDFETFFRFNLENEIITFDLEITATSEINDEDDEEKPIEEECFNIRLRNLFSVKDLKKHVEEGEIKQDENFLVLIASLSYSSARGILNEKLSSSRYGRNFLLPVINPKNFVSKKSKESQSKDK